MVKRYRRGWLWIAAGLATTAALAWAFAPTPVRVDLALVTEGPMRVTVDQEGKTRVKDRYVVSAPLGGELRRIALDVGDALLGGQTLLATIDPTPPSLLDERARREALARVEAARAALAQAQPAIARAQAQLAQAKIDHQRVSAMAARDAASVDERDQAALAVAVRQAELEAALAARQVARFGLQLAEAALERTGDGASGTTRPAPFEIVSPIDGRVFRVLRESQGPVSAGTALLELGDVRRLEAVIDVLSRDAVSIHPGDSVLLERWGGDEPLTGRVRYVEPSGFTKVSALGIEEQRVNAIVDFADPRQRLGDNYRVEARIITWQAPRVIQVPAGALFRSGDDWAVFVVHDGRARVRSVRIGHMSDSVAQVLEGLVPGDQVVSHPSDKIADGVRVRGM